MVRHSHELVDLLTPGMVTLQEEYGDRAERLVLHATCLSVKMRDGTERLVLTADEVRDGSFREKFLPRLRQAMAAEP